MRMQTIAVAALLIAAVAAAEVRVQLSLKRPVSEAAIEREFVERSTPGYAKYQQHLTPEQLTQLVQASPATVAAAERFFAGAAGVRSAQLFATRDVYTAVVDRQSPLAAELGLSAAMFEPSAVRHAVPVPGALAAHVERIVVVPPRDGKKQRAGAGGKLHYAKGGNNKKQAGEAGALPFPGMAQTPKTIKERYAVPAGQLTSASVQGVGEFQDSYFKEAWMRIFSANNSLPTPDIRISGPNDPSQDDVEGTLDLEYITAIADGATTWWVSSNDTSTDPFGIDFNWWCAQAASLSPMPKVVSLSWGIGEDNYAGKEAVLIADNDGFRKLGLLGVSVFAASGDTGPGSRGFTSCTRFDPGWPASSPYVTTVGATYADTQSAGEVAVSFSGGGFSDYFPTPEWQKAAVASYLQSTPGLPKASFFNASGRAFPDVSALGTNFMVYGADQFGQEGWMPIAGTSCASPTFAAVITRINAERIAAGKSTLGFLNPTIYQMGTVGYDVTSGTSQDPDCFGFDFAGFPAAAGWDAVSGLGTPNYATLKAHLVASTSARMSAGVAVEQPPKKAGGRQ